MPVLLYDRETMLWIEKERSRIRAVQMDDLRGLQIVMRMNRVPNVRIRELCGVAKWVGEIIEKVFSKGFAIWKKWKN